MATKVTEEAHELTQLESGIVATDVEPGDDLAEWDNLWRFQVPVGYSYVFNPADIFSLYLLDLAEYVEGAVADDGGSYTDETVEAREATANDMTILPATPAVNDAYYFGSRHPFNNLIITCTTIGEGVWVITWEYYNGSAWAALPGIVDGSAAAGAGFTAASPWTISWTKPPDWAKYAGAEVIGHSLYWVRARVSGYTSVTTQPLADYAYVGNALEHRATDVLKIEIRDPSEGGRKQLLNPTPYAQLKEFQDVDLVAHLDVPGAVVANEGEWIAIMGMSTAGVMDVSASHFRLTCKRVRRSLFGG